MDIGDNVEGVDSSSTHSQEDEEAVSDFLLPSDDLESIQALLVGLPQKHATSQTFAKLVKSDVLCLSALLPASRKVSGVVSEGNRLPAAVIFVLCMNRFAAASEAHCMMRHSWWPTGDGENLTAFARRGWHRAVAGEYQARTPFQQLRLSSLHVSYLWDRPDTDIMMVRILETEVNEGGSEYFLYATDLVSDATESESVERIDDEDDCMLIICMETGVLLTSIGALLKQPESHVTRTAAATSPESALIFLFRGDSPACQSWLEERLIKYENGMESVLATRIGAAFDHLQQGHSMLGVTLRVWSDLYDRLFPGE